MINLKDDFDRTQAKTQIDQNTIVIAGAGTGKTHLLVDRITYTALGKDVPITEIVSLTFTEKAAAEMKSRLMELMRDILSVETMNNKTGNDEIKILINDLCERFNLSPSLVFVRARQVLNDLDKAQIGTIHSFCAHLLRLYPLEAGVDPSFEVDEGLYENIIFDHEWHKWLETELSSSSPNSAQWLELLRKVELDDIRNLARTICSPRVNIRELRNQQNFETKIKPLKEEVDNLLEKHSDSNKGRLYKIQSQLMVAKKVLEYVLSSTPIELSSDDENWISKPVGKAGDWSDDEVNRVKTILVYTKALINQSEQIINQALDLLTSFVDRFAEVYKKEGYVSFDGLLVYARDLVKTNFRVREELKTTYKTILIDEFQDTDPLQGELILYLAEKSGGKAKNWDEIKLAPGKLFIVGDPKQSIYRFRKADIQAFQNIVEFVKNQGAGKWALKTNFRSNSRIVDGVNTIFSPLIQAKGFIQPEYIPIEYHPEHVADREEQIIRVVTVEKPIHTENEKKLSAEEAREGEAEYIANWIKNSVDKIGVRDKTGILRSLGYGDIAILLRATTKIGTYIESLKQHDIPYVVTGEKYFYTTQEILDFLNILRAVDDPENKIALIGILRSPLGGLTDKEIYELNQKNMLSYLIETVEHKDEAVADKVNKLYTQLRKLHNLSWRVPISELVKKIVQETFILELATLSYHQQQTVSNINKFVSLCRTIADEPGLTLKEYIIEIEHRIKTVMEEGESPLVDETVPMVRVMTIHKAKGLEFPVVMLVNMHGKIQTGNKQIMLQDWYENLVGLQLGEYKNLMLIYLEDKETEREKEEEKRVFYVAATRAREQLIMLGKSSDGTDNSFSGLLQQSIDNLSADKDYKINIKFEPYNFDPGKSSGYRKRQKPSKKKLDFEHLRQVFNQREKRYQEIVNTPLFVTPSSIEKLSIQKEKLESATESKMLVGTLCHSVLEQWELGQVATKLDKLLSNNIEWLKLFNLEEDWELIRNEANNILSTFFNSPAYEELKQIEIIGREVPFLYSVKSHSDFNAKLGEESRQICKGTIDLLGKKDEKLIIIDYKTDRVIPDKIKEKITEYQPQTAIYKQAISRMYPDTELIFQLLFLRINKLVTI